ncbi:MAG: hypothetical protein V2A76_12810 [Planctomycetota bacterium]
MRAPILLSILLLPLLALVSGCRSFPDPPPGWEGEFSAEHALELALGLTEDGEEEKEPRPAPPELVDLMASISVVRHDSEPPARMSSIILWKKPGLWSVEQDGPGKETVKFVCDGSRAAEIREGKVVRRGVRSGEVGVDLLLRHLFLLNYFLEGPGGRAWIDETIRNEDGGYYLRIAKDDEVGHRWVLSLDAESLEPVALREWFSSSDGRFRPLDTRFFDLTRDSRGNLIPRKMLSYVNGTLFQEMQIRDLAWNRGLKPIDFQVP